MVKEIERKEDGFICNTFVFLLFCFLCIKLGDVFDFLEIFLLIVFLFKILFGIKIGVE